MLDDLKRELAELAKQNARVAQEALLAAQRQAELEKRLAAECSGRFLQAVVAGFHEAKQELAGIARNIEVPPHIDSVSGKHQAQMMFSVIGPSGRSCTCTVQAVMDAPWQDYSFASSCIPSPAQPETQRLPIETTTRQHVVELVLKHARKAMTQPS